MIIVFSKDRAFQLEACLRTLLTRCRDANQVPIRVLWTASGPGHRQSYAILRDSLRHSPNIEFIEESGFRSDLIAILGGIAPGSWRDRAVRRLERLSASWTRNLIQPLMNLLLRPAPAVLYVVDDTVFLRSFSFTECASRLLAKPDGVAFSLRLGEGLTRFYMGSRPQKVPELMPLDGGGEVYQYPWAEADGDFAYPLEISSSVLKSNLILPRLLRKKWQSPNTLELALANMAGRYKQSHPLVLTFREQRAVSIPLNIVQQDFTGNRFGGMERYQPDRLCDLFLKGIRADLSRLDQMSPTAVHIEIDLLPTS